MVVTKTFRLWQATDGLEVELKFESPDKERQVRLQPAGPARHPDRGRVVHRHFPRHLLRAVNEGKIKIDTHRRPTWRKRREKPIENTTLCRCAFAGVENQYFATLIEPDPAPDRRQERIDDETKAIALHREDPKAVQKLDVGVRITSKPIKVGPDRPGRPYSTGFSPAPRRPTR